MTIWEKEMCVKIMKFYMHKYINFYAINWNMKELVEIDHLMLRCTIN